MISLRATAATYSSCLWRVSLTALKSAQGCRLRWLATPVIKGCCGLSWHFCDNLILVFQVRHHQKIYLSQSDFFIVHLHDRRHNVFFIRVAAFCNRLPAEVCEVAILSVSKLKLIQLFSATCSSTYSFHDFTILNYLVASSIFCATGRPIGLNWTNACYLFRHPSNLMLCRESGKVVHIDFGDCFEVAMMREKFPEKVPFRLTRMIIAAMEVRLDIFLNFPTWFTVRVFCLQFLHSDDFLSCRIDIRVLVKFDTTYRFV